MRHIVCPNRTACRNLHVCRHPKVTTMGHGRWRRRGGREYHQTFSCKCKSCAYTMKPTYWQLSNQDAKHAGASFFITINLVYEYVLRQQTKQIIPREGASGPPQKGNQQLRNKERNPATATDSSAPESIGVLVRPIRHTAQMSTDTRFLLLQVKTLPSTNTLKPKHSSLRILVRRRKVYGVQGGHGYLLGST